MRVWKKQQHAPEKNLKFRIAPTLTLSKSVASLVRDARLAMALFVTTDDRLGVAPARHTTGMVQVMPT